MSDNTVSLIVNLRGNVDKSAQRFSQSLGRMSAKSRRHLKTMERGVTGLDRTMSRLGNRYLALGSGGAIAVAAKKVIDFDASLTQLGVDANMTSKQIEEVRDRIHEVANMPNIRVGRNDLLSAMLEVTARIGDVEVAKDNLENIGLTMRATGAQAQDAASLVANFYEKFDIENSQKMRSALSESAVLGKEGAFELRNLATEGNSVAAAYAATGRTGPTAIREMNAMLQIIRSTAPSAAEAATNFERLLSAITVQKVGIFTGAGIKIWDEEQLAKGNKISRAVPDIIHDILKATKGDQEVLGSILDIPALKAMNAFAIEYRKTGTVDSINKLMGVRDANGVQLLEDAGRNAKTAKASLSLLNNSFDKFADSNLSDPIKDVALWIDKIDSDKFQEMLETTKNWALALGGAVVSIKAISTGIKVKNSLGKNKENAVRSVLGGSKLTPMHVWVVNQGVGGGFDKDRKGRGRINSTSNSTKSTARSTSSKLGKVSGALAAIPFVTYVANEAWKSVQGMTPSANLNSLHKTSLRLGVISQEEYDRRLSEYPTKTLTQTLSDIFSSSSKQPSTVSNYKSRLNERNGVGSNTQQEPARVIIEVKDKNNNTSASVQRNSRAPDTTITQSVGRSMGTL